jgi:hypothetical protein
MKGATMKSTSPLKVLCTVSMSDNRLNMHPNEGADLGLMMTRYSLTIDEGLQADLHLLNECPKESVEIGQKFWERLGKPARAVISYDGSILKIEKA